MRFDVLLKNLVTHIMEEQEDLQTAIENIHYSLIERTSEIIAALTGGGSIGEDATSWVEYANQLLRLVPQYAEPVWLIDACGRFGTTFYNDSEHRSDIAKFVTSRLPEIQKPIVIGEAATLDLDQLFNTQSERFELTSVFEKLVTLLSELIAADVIENRVVHDSLKRLNALFRRNKNCLLYTSPSPRDQRGSRMPSSA